MRIVNDINTINSERAALAMEATAVTIGKFEALHKGHQRLIAQIVSYKKEGLVPTVLTFKNASVSLGKSNEKKQFLDDEIRHSFLEKLGIELLVEIEFNKAFADMSPEMFVKEVLVDRLNAKEIITGINFRFGKDRAGDVALLKKLSDIYAYNYYAIDLEKYGDTDISTTYAKELLSKKDYYALSKILGNDYPLKFK